MDKCTKLVLDQLDVFLVLSLVGSLFIVGFCNTIVWPEEWSKSWYYNSQSYSFDYYHTKFMESLWNWS